MKLQPESTISSYLAGPHRQRMLSCVQIAMIAAWFLIGCAGHNTYNVRQMDGTESNKEVFTVMTFNIRHGCGVDNWGNSSSSFLKTCQKDLQTIAEAIASAEPDVVGLQEVDRGQARILAKKLNMNYAFSTHNASGYGSWWGNAILSKSTISKSTKISIGGIANRNRSIISASMQLKGRTVEVISVHTHHRLNSPESVRKIMQYVNKTTDPVILMGDFNMSPGDPRWEEIKKASAGSKRVQKGSRVSDRHFLDTVEETESNYQDRIKVHVTFPGLGRIDYVLVEETFFDVRDAKLVAEKYRNASDHYAFFAVIAPMWN